MSRPLAIWLGLDTSSNSQGCWKSGISRAETLNPVSPAFGREPLPTAPSSRISPPHWYDFGISRSLLGSNLTSKTVLGDFYSCDISCSFKCNKDRKKGLGKHDSHQSRPQDMVILQWGDCASPPSRQSRHARLSVSTLWTSGEGQESSHSGHLAPQVRPSSVSESAFLLEYIL